MVEKYKNKKITNNMEDYRGKMESGLTTRIAWITRNNMGIILADPTAKEGTRRIRRQLDIER